MCYTYNPTHDLINYIDSFFLATNSLSILTQGWMSVEYVNLKATRYHPFGSARAVTIFYKIHARYSGKHTDLFFLNILQ